LQYNFSYLSEVLQQTVVFLDQRKPLLKRLRVDIIGQLLLPTIGCRTTASDISEVRRAEGKSDLFTPIIAQPCEHLQTVREDERMSSGGKRESSL
jgi:hypothetical protein